MSDSWGFQFRVSEYIILFPLMHFYCVNGRKIVLPTSLIVLIIRRVVLGGLAARSRVTILEVSCLIFGLGLDVSAFISI